MLEVLEVVEVVDEVVSPGDFSGDSPGKRRSFGGCSDG